MGLFKRRDGASLVATDSASWLTYPTLTHGDASMVKLAGAHVHRTEITDALRRFGPLVLAELRIEQSGEYAGAARVYVGGAQVASVPAGMADSYRETVEAIRRENQPATIHAELEVGDYVDVWGLCKPLPRQEGEPLMPTQYREDVRLFTDVAASLDESLRSRAKEKKVRRTGSLALGSDGIWSVSESDRAIGTLEKKPYRRLHEIMSAGLPLDVVVTIHRVPERPLAVHVSVPPDA